MNRVVAKTATKNASKRLGTHLRALRTERTWTQRLVANEVGVDSVTLRRWELGMFSPSLENLERLAAIFEVDLDSLMQVVSAPEPTVGQSVIPNKGYVDAGTAKAEYDVDLGLSCVPMKMIEKSPNSLARTVSGDSLTADGIHDGDILIISPDEPPTPGRISIIQLGTAYCGAVHIPGVGFRWRTGSGRTESLASEDVEFKGAVIGHIRKM